MGRLRDYLVTFCCWFHFIFGYLFFFAPLHLVALLLPQRQQAMQRVNHLFFKSFFVLLKRLTPTISWQIDPRLQQCWGTVMVCNHLSYLDPILFVSLLPRAKSIVKTVFFQVPIFAHLLQASGFFPASGSPRATKMMIKQMDGMADYFATGGNVFVFPEGTRSTGQQIAPLNHGALKIARLCQAPLVILRLGNTQKLFKPGHFFFHSQIRTTISLDIVEIMRPEEVKALTLNQLEERIRSDFQND